MAEILELIGETTQEQENDNQFDLPIPQQFDKWLSIKRVNSTSQILNSNIVDHLFKSHGDTKQYFLKSTGHDKSPS